MIENNLKVNLTIEEVGCRKTHEVGLVGDGTTQDTQGTQGTQGTTLTPGGVWEIGKLSLLEPGVGKGN